MIYTASLTLEEDYPNVASGEEDDEADNRKENIWEKVKAI